MIAASLSSGNRLPGARRCPPARQCSPPLPRCRRSASPTRCRGDAIRQAPPRSLLDAIGTQDRQRTLRREASNATVRPGAHGCQSTLDLRAVQFLLFNEAMVAQHRRPAIDLGYDTAPGQRLEIDKAILWQGQPFGDRLRDRVIGMTGETAAQASTEDSGITEDSISVATSRGLPSVSFRSCPCQGAQLARIFQGRRRP